MFIYYPVLFLLNFVFIRQIMCIDLNDTAFLISKYAKVSHWGQTTTENTLVNEGRSQGGQSLWTHRSDANIISEQHLKNDVAYHYALSKKQYPPKVAQEKTDNVPSIGEVQERFNPKPYFDYGPPKRQKSPSSDRKPLTVGASYPSPVYNPPNVQSPTSDSYDSPFDSYNPPSINGDSTSSVSEPVYPPIGQPDSKEPKPDSPQPPKQIGYVYGKNTDTDQNPNFYKSKPGLDLPKNPPKPHSSFGPPLAPPQDEMDDDHDQDHVFYPPKGNGHNEEVILDHPPPGFEDSDYGNGDANDNSNMGIHQDMASDLNPPPPNANGNGYMNGDDNNGKGHGNFPQYLYNGLDSDPHFSPYDLDHHHVYEEVEPPATHPPEDKRVNKGQYSYYYLGRKLWYIPLYFSVYFIIYVTLLIIKSIARHKIHLKHELHDKFREGREMSYEEEVDDLHKNVTVSIVKATEKYMM